MKKLCDEKRCTNLGTSYITYLTLNHRSSSTNVTVNSKLKYVNADVTSMTTKPCALAKFVS
jgi:hypothetical protein